MRQRVGPDERARDDRRRDQLCRSSPPATLAEEAAAHGLEAEELLPHPRDARARRLRGGGLPWLTSCASARSIPDLMNIYADRGNLPLLRERCEWRGLGLRAQRRRPRRRARPGRARPLLHRRRPGPRPGAVRRGSRDDQARGAARGGRRPARSIFAVCGGYQLLGHAYELGRRASSPASASSTCETVREDGPRLIGNVAIEVDLDGTPSRSSPASRTTAAAPAWERRRARSAASSRVTATTVAVGYEGVRGGAHGHRRRHLPPRPAPAQERVVRGLADRHGAAPRPVRTSRRWTTASRTPRHAAARRAAGI